MKFTCTQPNLAYGLSVAEKVIGKNFSLPILQNILVSCEKNTGFIRLSATDLEVGVEISVPAKIEEEGAVTVPAKLLNGFVRSLPEENVEFLEKGKKITIKCGNYKSNIKGEGAKEFPLIPVKQTTEAFPIKKEDLLFGISSVMNSASILDVKPEISGVYIQFQEKETCFAATDSFRLSEKKINNDQKNTYIDKIIIPKKGCDLIMRIFQDIDKEKNMTFQVTKNQICINSSNKDSLFPKITFVSRIIDGEYPNYEQIIPSSFSTEIKVQKSDLIHHIKTASIFCGKTSEIGLQTNPAKKQLEITARDQEYGDHHSTLSCEIKGAEEKVLFNFQYLLDGIQNISSPVVSIKLNQATTPVLISATEGDGFRYVLMPVKI